MQRIQNGRRSPARETPGLWIRDSGALVTASRDPELKIAVLSTWAARCGIADYTSFLVGGLSARVGWKIYAESMTCNEPASDRVSLNWEIGLDDVSRLDASLRLDRLDALLVQHNPAFFSGDRFERLVELSRKHAVPLAVTFHSVPGLEMKPDVVPTLRRIDRIWVHRASDVTWLEERGVRGNVGVLPHGVPSFPRRSVEEAKETAGLPGRFVVGNFGFLRPHKGTLELIKAFDLLAPDVPSLDLLLLCSEYPNPDSHEYRAACDRRIAKSPWRSRIHARFCHLPIEQVGSLLQACDVVAFPYAPSLESSSAAVRMAVAARRPILVTASSIFEDLTGAAEVAASHDPRVLAAQLSRLIAGPGALGACAARVEALADSTTWPRVAAQVAADVRRLSPRSRSLPVGV